MTSDIEAPDNAGGSGIFSSNNIFLVVEIGAFVLALAALAWLKTRGLAFTTAPPATVAGPTPAAGQTQTLVQTPGYGFNASYVLSLFTPILLAATCIERSVEVLISPWRDTGADVLSTNITTAKTAPDAAFVGGGATKAKAVGIATKELHEYRGTTKQYAFLISLVLGLFAGLAGVRALDPFLSPGALDAANLGLGQKQLFMGFDLFLTATLIAGGADGIHSIVTMFTSFFQATANRASGTT